MTNDKLVARWIALAEATIVELRSDEEGQAEVSPKVREALITVHNWFAPTPYHGPSTTD